VKLSSSSIAKHQIDIGYKRFWSSTFF